MIRPSKTYRAAAGLSIAAIAIGPLFALMVVLLFCGVNWPENTLTAVLVVEGAVGLIGGGCAVVEATQKTIDAGQRARCIAFAIVCFGALAPAALLLAAAWFLENHRGASFV